MADTEDEKDLDLGLQAFTPFGVIDHESPLIVDTPEAARKAFTEETFFDEVLLPAEKEQLKKNKEAYLKDPGAKGTVQEVQAGFRFTPWKKPVIASAGRNSLAFQKILSNTWALNKEAIPDFLDLLEKMRQKYSTVLGDDKLLQHLEAAQHRARELQAGAEVPEAATSSVKVQSAVVSESDLDDDDVYNFRPREDYHRMLIDSQIQIEEDLRAMGWKVELSSSNVSDSFYVTILKEGENFDGSGDVEYKIRFSDHYLPAHYGGGDADFLILWNDDCSLLDVWEDEKTKFQKLWDEAQGGVYSSAKVQSSLEADVKKLVQGGASTEEIVKDISEGYPEADPGYVEMLVDSMSGNLGKHMGGAIFHSKRVQSAVEVDQAAYDEYIQQLVAQGIPEDQAKQMADNMVNQIRQNTAKFAASVGGQQQQGQQNNNGMFSSRKINSVFGWNENNQLAEQLLDAIESGEIDAPPLGDVEQAQQLVRLCVKAMQNGQSSVSAREVDKYAHAAYEPGELKEIFKWVKDHAGGGVNSSVSNKSGSIRDQVLVDEELKGLLRTKLGHELQDIGRTSMTDGFDTFSPNDPAPLRLANFLSMKVKDKYGCEMSNRESMSLVEEILSSSASNKSGGKGMYIKSAKTRDQAVRIQEHILSFFDSYEGMLSEIQYMYKNYGGIPGLRQMVEGGSFLGYSDEAREFLTGVYNTPPEMQSKYSDEVVWERYINLLVMEMSNILRNPRGGGKNYIFRQGDLPVDVAQGKRIQSGGKGMGRLIKSDGDVIVHQDDDEESEEESGEDFDMGMDEGTEGGGDEGTLDFGEGDSLADDAFADDVNSIDEFGSDDPSLGKEEVVDAIQAISQIVETVLDSEGVSEGEGLTSDESGFVLDEVDDLAAGFDDEGGDGETSFDMGEEPMGDLPEEEESDFDEIGASFVRVMVAGNPIKSQRLARPSMTTEKVLGSDVLVCSGHEHKFSFVDPVKVGNDAVFETLVLSTAPEITPNTPIQSGFTQASDYKKWIKQSRNHYRAWRAASSRVASGLGHRPASAREKSAVLFLANSFYDKYFGNPKLDMPKLFSGVKPKAVRRVVAALQERLSNGKSLKVLKSDYNGYKNYETWNVSIYLRNDKAIKSRAVALLKSGKVRGYDQLIQSLGLSGQETSDGVAWSDKTIDRGQMETVLKFLGNSYKGKGMAKIRSDYDIDNKTQVDGSEGEVDTVQDDTNTGLAMANKTKSSPEIEDPNTEKVLNVDGGDTSEWVDVHNTGEGGTLEADVKAGENDDNPGYSFGDKNTATAAIELPIDSSDMTQVLEMKQVGSGVYILKQAYESRGAGRVSFLRGRDAYRKIHQNAKPVKAIKANVDKVLTLSDGKRGLFLKSSPVLGVVAVEAPIYKGIKNCKYSLFSRAGANLINEDGYYMPSTKGPQTVIASAVSNKAVHKGSERRNLIAEIESAYIGFLKSNISGLIRSNGDLKGRLDSALLAQKRREAVHSQMLNREKRNAREQVASALGGLDKVKKQAAEAEAQRVFAGTRNAIREEEKLIKSQAERNVEWLAQQMGYI